MSDSKLPRMRVHYYPDGDGAEPATDVVVVGQWELTLSERKYGVGQFKLGNLEAITYATYLSAKRAGIVADNVGFEAWGATVALTEAVEAGESPAPPAT